MPNHVNKSSAVFPTRLQEPIAAALFGTCVLRGMAEKIPTGYKAVREDFEKNANELEQLATGLHMMKSDHLSNTNDFDERSGKYTVDILV